MATAIDIFNRYPALRSIYLLRDDIAGDDRTLDEGRIGCFLLWAAVFGRKDYHGIVIDRDYFEYLTSPTRGYLSRLELFVATIGKRPQQPMTDLHVWYYGKGIHDYNLEMFVSAGEILALEKMSTLDQEHGGSLTLRERIVHKARSRPAQSLERSRPPGHTAFTRSLPEEERSRPWLSLPARTEPACSGVNLIGFADGVLGIGEDVRALAAVLRRSGIPFAIYNVALSDQHATSEPNGLFPYFVDRPVFPINIFCTTAFETERLRVERGANLFAGRYNIGYWPWELNTLPAYWRHVFDGVDEVWAISRYLAGVYVRQTAKPVTYVPPYVNIDRIERFDRSGIPIGADDFVFFTMLDFNSFVARKNPMGAVDAFTLAFPDKRSGERLLIKTINGHAHPDKLDRLVALIDKDPRIVVMDGPLSRAGTCGLISEMDCFVSLHRAEGFGRVIAEAMYLGTPVVATDYSGSRTFLDATTGFPVGYELRDVDPDEYVYPEGSQWAEPNLDNAAAQLRVVRNETSLVAGKVAKARQRIARDHGLDGVAKTVSERLRGVENRR